MSFDDLVPQRTPFGQCELAEDFEIVEIVEIVEINRVFVGAHFRL
ncbi:MAG: hypothetical protein ACJAQ9_002956 [Ilumatobacter sp.]|jgi:hypothetical protein